MKYTPIAGTELFIKEYKKNYDINTVLTVVDTSNIPCLYLYSDKQKSSNKQSLHRHRNEKQKNRKRRRRRRSMRGRVLSKTYRLRFYFNTRGQNAWSRFQDFRIFTHFLQLPGPGLVFNGALARGPPPPGSGAVQDVSPRRIFFCVSSFLFASGVF